jgi:hypothetical protein
MSRGRETNEVEILDTAFHHRGGELGWSVFGDSRLDPSELVERMEEGDFESGVVRAAVMGAMLDICLEGWARECDVEKVGERGEALGRALGYVFDGGLAMLGAVARIGGEVALPVACKVLDSWFWDCPGTVDLGKRLLALGRFLNHPELDGWSVRGLAKGCCESRTWMSKRVRRECNKPIEAAGGRGVASWQQSPDQRERSAEARRESFRKSRAEREISEEFQNKNENEK